jgi:hypothetical protein
MAQNEKQKGRLLQHFKTEAALEAAARDYDIEAFRQACGGSARKAAELIAQVLGSFDPGFLANERAVAIHESVVELVSGYARTAHARNRLGLLRPLAKGDDIRARLELCLAAGTAPRSSPGPRSKDCSRAFRGRSSRRPDSIPGR